MRKICAVPTQQKWRKNETQKDETKTQQGCDVEKAIDTFKKAADTAVKVYRTVEPIVKTIVAHRRKTYATNPEDAGSLSYGECAATEFVRPFCNYLRGAHGASNLPTSNSGATSLKWYFLAARFHSIPEGIAASLRHSADLAQRKVLTICWNLSFFSTQHVMGAETPQCEGLAPNVTTQFVIQCQ